jgi:hypothetical protein
MAHLHPGLLACWAVSTVRCQLKGKEQETASQFQNTENSTDIPPVHFRWKEIMRIMNTPKAVTAVSQNRCDEVIISRRCSDPAPRVNAIYRQNATFYQTKICSAQIVNLKK